MDKKKKPETCHSDERSEEESRYFDSNLGDSSLLLSLRMTL
jgi:hypothetical protein